MSLFKKPSRKVRQRLAHADSDEEDHTSLLRTKEERKNKDKDDRVRTTKTLLSFGATEEETEGEVFKVKKSSYSRRIAKELEKERKRKKDPDDEKGVEGDEEKVVTKQSIPKTSSTKKIGVIESDGIDDIDIRIKNSIKINKKLPPPSTVERRESEEIGDENMGEGIVFNRNRMTKVLADGAIPDADTIFALKKKRQQMAGKCNDEFLPINDSKESNGRNRDGRLARDEDDDSGPEDGRLNFSDIRSGKIEEMREAFGGDDDDDEEDNEALRWEKEQIRKGVGTLASVQDLRDFHRSPSPNPEDRYRSATLPPVHIPTDKSGLTVTSIVDRVRDRIKTVEEIVARTTRQYTMTSVEMDVCAESIQKLEKSMPQLDKEFKFYQEMRTYSVDLVECLDAKFAIITALEDRYVSSQALKAERMMSRRRQDMKDQSDEVRSPSTAEAALKKRACEREGRRMRRKTIRQASPQVKHFEGMSSDEEEIETDRIQLANDLDQIVDDRAHIFEDVNDDFAKLTSIIDKFEKWKKYFNETYVEAYIPICVLKLVVPFVRLELIDWNPLEEPEALEKSNWYRELLFYGYESEESDESDLTLIPKVIERAIIPKVTRYVDRIWDPMSATQTRNLVRCMHKITDDFTVGKRSKPLATLLGKIHTKLQNSLAEDVFIPMASKEVTDNPLSPAGMFFHRQFWAAIKLLGNMLSWHGILSEKSLRELSLVGLLNRYLLFALQCSMAHKDTVDRVTAIGAMLPTTWLRSDQPPELQMFAKFLEGFLKHLKSSYAPDLKIQIISKLHESCTQAADASKK